MSSKLGHWLAPASLCVAFALGLSACGGGGGDVQGVTPEKALSPAAALGKKIFFDETLSESGRQACSTCHVPERAHAGDDGLAVPRGGPDMTTPGFRNAPSLRYLEQNTAFFFAGDGTPTGGFNRDGRANTLAEQARRPLLAAHEMANGTAAAFAAKLQAASYVNDFTSLYGSDVFSDADTVLARATQALQQYETEDAGFHPYSSRYDDFLRGKAQLNAQELRGMALFNDPQKGNCAGCHPSTLTSGGRLPLFTDFTYDNLGVPRNTDIPANADPSYYDFGLCGPERTDLSNRIDLCGAFKVPTLRNITHTAPYFHNGRFATLKDALRFYVRRDTNPDEWYPLNADGSVEKFNDLLPEYRRFVNTTEVPYNRHLGDEPALSDSEIDDVIVFLDTLSDADLSSSAP